MRAHSSRAAGRSMSSISRRCSSTHCSGMIEAVPQTTASHARGERDEGVRVPAVEQRRAVGLDQLRRGGGVAAGVLQAGDRQLAQLLGGERDARDAGQVVVHDRDRDRVRDRLEVRLQLAPGGRVVERRDDHHRGRAGLLGVHAQLDRLARRERARCPRPPGRGRRRPRRSTSISCLRSALVSVVNSPVLPPGTRPPTPAPIRRSTNARQRVGVDRAPVLGEGRDQRGQDAVEGSDMGDLSDS